MLILASIQIEAVKEARRDEARTNKRRQFELKAQSVEEVTLRELDPRHHFKLLLATIFKYFYLGELRSIAEPRSVGRRQKILRLQFQDLLLRLARVCSHNQARQLGVVEVGVVGKDNHCSGGAGQISSLLEQDRAYKKYVV